MIRLNKKKETQPQPTEEALQTSIVTTNTLNTIDGNNSASSTIIETSAIVDSKDDTNTISLFGIGGKKIKSDTDGKKTGKKRTPGEIRIQKG